MVGGYCFFLEQPSEAECLSSVGDQMMLSLGYGASRSTFQSQGLVETDPIVGAT